MLGSAFASCLHKSPSWPLPSGLGGVVGDALISVPEYVLGPRTGMTLIAFAVILGIATLATVIVAAGFGWRDHSAGDVKPRKKRKVPARVVEEDDEDEPRTSISLGWLVHGFLSVKARLMRWVFRRTPAAAAPVRRAPMPVVSERDRFEPKFAASAEPELDEEEAEEEEDAPVPVQRAAPKDSTKAARKPAGRKSGGYELPSLNLLAAARATDRFAPSQEAIEATAKTLESVLGTSACAARSSTRARARW